MIWNPHYIYIFNRNLPFWRDDGGSHDWETGLLIICSNCWNFWRCLLFYNDRIDIHFDEI